MHKELLKQFYNKYFFIKEKTLIQTNQQLKRWLAIFKPTS